MPNELSVDDISVVTTTFNEREFIKPFVDRVRKALASFSYELIIVEDSSPNGTYEEARKYADKVVLEHRVGGSFKANARIYYCTLLRIGRS